MSPGKPSKAEDGGHLFTLEVLIRGKTNSEALEKLAHLFNAHAEDAVDYRIISGIELGNVIDSALKLSRGASPKAVVHHTHTSIIQQIEQYREDNTLVRLSVLKGKGVKLNIPCRILNYDLASGNMTVYHVDEKKVYSFQINEIEDLHT